MGRAKLHEGRRRRDRDGRAAVGRGAGQGQHGREGEAPEDAALEEVRIYVPVQRDVDPEFDEQPTLGAGGQIRKRG